MNSGTKIIGHDGNSYLIKDFAIQENYYLQEAQKNLSHIMVDVLDTEEFVKLNNIKQVTDPVFFVRPGVPTPEGLLSNEIFGITTDERATTFAYIDLHDWFLHPLAYTLWSRMDSRIVNIVHGTKKYRVVDGDFVEDEENGKCGIKFLKDNFEKLKIKTSESRRRNANIQFLTENFKNIFIKKFMVIPAYYRDVLSTEGRVGVGDLNKYYSSILVAVRSITETEEYGFSMADATRGRIQTTIVNIYNMLCGTGNAEGIGLSKKLGIIRRNVMSKTTDYGTRLIISSPNVVAENVDSLMVDMDHAAVPLSAALVTYKPFIIFEVKRLFENEFVNFPTHTALSGKSKTPVQVEIENPEMVFSDEEIEDQMKKFIHGYSKRLEPVLVPIKGGSKVKVMFRGRNASSDDPSRTSPLQERPLTWCDVFYMAAVAATRDKVILITRFPMDSYWNQFPAKVRISTTQETEPIYVGTEYYEWYPKIRLEDIGKNTSDMFIDTLGFTNANLTSICGDYDGDQCGGKGVWSVEANEEQLNIINSKAYYLDLNCINIKVATNEAILSIYCLTKVLPQDEGKLTNPVF